MGENNSPTALKGCGVKTKLEKGFCLQKQAAAERKLYCVLFLMEKWFIKKL